MADHVVKLILIDDIGTDMSPGACDAVEIGVGKNWRRVSRDAW